MFLRFRFVLLAIVLPCVVFVSCDKEEGDPPYDVFIDFQDVVFPEGQKYNNNSGIEGKFTKGIVSFQNYCELVQDDEWGDYTYWYGFAYSQMHDITTPGYENEFSVYALNDEEENKFMVGYFAPWEGQSIDITFSQPVKDLSFDVANTTWAALAMKDGRVPARKFTETDWFELTIKVTSTDAIETIIIKMGDGTKITNVWNNIQVQSNNITKLEFSLDSSDTGMFGINTPTYFCIDNIKARIVK